MTATASQLAARARRLQEVIARATEAPSLEEIARVIVEEGVAALDGTMGALWLVRDDALELLHWTAYRPADAFRRVPLAGDAPLARAVASRQPLWFSSFAEYAASFPGSAKRLRDSGTGPELAVACLPLVSRGRAVGGLVFAYAAAREFSDDERGFLVAIARQCAHAMERVRLIEEERQVRVRAESLAGRMRELQELAGELSSATTPAQVAEVFLARGMASVAAYNGAIWMVDGGSAVMLGQVRYSQQAIEMFRTVPLDSPAPLTHAITKAQPSFLGDRGAYREQFEAIEARTRALNPPGTIAAVACLPLFAGPGVCGGISFGWREAHDFDEAEREYLQLIARHCGQALERARLQAENTRAALRLRKLHDVIAALSSATTPNEIASTIVRLGAEAVEASTCAIWMREPDGSLRAIATHGPPPEWIDQFRVITASSGLPAWDIVERGTEMWVEGAADWQQGTALYEDARAAGRLLAYAALPLAIDGRTVGAVAFGYEGRRRFADEDRHYLRTLARHAEQALERAQLYVAEAEARRQAEAASRAKDEFLAMLGHELRNPLAPIVGALDLMEMREPKALARERAILGRQVKHLVRLVDDLLDVARIARGIVELRRAPLELSRAVEQAIETTSGVVASRRHRLEVDVPASGIVIDADGARVAQVLSNLVSNAAKYTPPGGVISVRGDRDGDFARVRVRDTGAGIPPELLPRVFDLFVQGVRAADRPGGGLGLGLAIVKNLVELHGGRVAAASDGPGRGAELSVWLPLARAGAGVAHATTAAAAGPAGTGVRVLVVDDNADAAATLGELLRALGHHPHIVHDARAALAAAAAEPPELALLDLGLPEVDGFELALRLRELPALAATRLVAVTGYGQERDRVRSQQAGFAAHLVKPVGAVELRAQLEAVRRAVTGDAG